MKWIIVALLFVSLTGTAQRKQVSITIDDVPNVEIYKKQGFSSGLLSQISMQGIPVAIFINEERIKSNGFTRDNREGLAKWLKDKNITAGNHGYQHLNYGDITFEAFQEEVIKGEVVTSQILKHPPKYFRFPYNGLGKDSTAHARAKEFLQRRGYTLTPFTIEGQDWAFSSLYDEALKNKQTEKAAEIGRNYISFTLSVFDYFEKICQERYGRAISHIYLCHDNQLNTDYLMKLLTELRKRNYDFISLDQAMEDDVYQSEDYYTDRYGVSWVYRWVRDPQERKNLMRAEPENHDVE